MSEQTSSAVQRLQVPVEALRWRCDESALSFESTAELEPVSGVVGQDDAVEALRFGLEITAPGQNIFVRGLDGTGRLTLVRRLLEEIQAACPLAQDRIYAYNFDESDRPYLITLPRGEGEGFAAAVDELVDFIADGLAEALGAEYLRARRSALEQYAQGESEQIQKPFEAELRSNGLALVSLQAGAAVQPAIFPVHEGTPIPPEGFHQMLAKGQIDEAQAAEIRRRIETYSQRLQEVAEELAEIQRDLQESVRDLYQGEARTLLQRLTDKIEKAYPYEPAKEFLEMLLEDVVDRGLKELQEDPGFTELYRVNLVLGHSADEPCPIIVEQSPTLRNLLGTIDVEYLPGGGVRTDHMMIRAGSLLRADAGFLVLEARDVLAEPGAWKVLIDTLRSGRLEIIPPDPTTPWSGASLKPEPIEIQLKVILLGDPVIHDLLDRGDPHFPLLFKVLADFESTIERSGEGVELYARVLARIAREEGLPAFGRGAVALLAEHGARIAARRERLTARFGRIADLAREAAFLTTKGGGSVVGAKEVADSIGRARRRADLPARHFRKLVEQGTLRIELRDAVVGQVNGLAVIQAGQLTYGFPQRITATIGPGTAGTINIEREAELSGSIHTKGFYILGGCLRHLLQTHHPLAFSASVAFEQSYGGIDGDSASGAEMCCLISALTEIPLRQDLAMTGAIDQFGHVQAVGAVTEKIEGYYDTCEVVGLTGTQGVIIPAANVGELALRVDVVEQCKAGRFHVFAADTVHDALEILTGRVAGRPDDQELYPVGSIFHEAVLRAGEYWMMTRFDLGQKPGYEA